MGAPTFSLIIPTYNRPDIFNKTIECLENQKTNITFEVIVIDDFSTLPLPALGFGKGERVNWKLIRNDKNLGRAATRNRGIREAKGEYILMIDDDIWASHGLLQAHYEGQKRIGGGVVVGAVPPSPEITDTIWHRYINRRFERIHRRLLNEHLDYGLFLTGNVSVPRKLLNEIGGFDETFRDYSFEDTELGYRLYKAGAKFVHASDAVGYHNFNEDLNSICKKTIEMGRSSFLFARLHPEEARAIQYHSVTFGPWSGKEFVKNLVKILLLNRPVSGLLKILTEISATCRLNGLVSILLPLVELQQRALGVREESLAHRN